MRRFDASSAECLVFTYKAGLLASVAHDLKIRVTTFDIEVDERTRAIRARFAAASLRTVCAMRDDAEAPGTLTARDRREIDRHILRQVLEAGAYPEIAFTASSVDEKNGIYAVTGVLALHGRERRITVGVRQEGARFVGEARIHQPDFGIQPYSAMLGALKVRPDVTVRIAVPAAAS